MRRTTKGSIALTTIDAFMATAAYGSYARAGSELGLSPTTMMRRLNALEAWLHRPLIDSDNLALTSYGDDFVLTAARILELIDVADLRRDLSKARVHSDGVLTIEGELYQTGETAEIGRLLVGSRADLRGTKPVTKRISAHDPEIVEFLRSLEKPANK